MSTEPGHPDTPDTLPTLEALRAGPPTISVEQFAKVVGVSRPFGYQMVRDGEVDVLRMGKRVRVLVLPLLKKLEGR